MYYLRLSSSAEPSDTTPVLIYYCRHCGHEDSEVGAEKTCVLRTDIKQGSTNYEMSVNEFTKLDPTLPRIRTIRCPNQECPSVSDTVQNEVLYMRYSKRDMKYLYMCAHCDTTWRTDEQR